MRLSLLPFTSAPVVLGLLLAACGGSISSPSPPSSDDSAFAGSYGNCFVFQTGTANGGVGDFAGSALTVTQNGANVSATFGQGGSSSTLEFNLTTDTVASLASGGQSLTPGVQCAATDLGFSPATITASSGTLSRDANGIFLSVVGTVAATPSADSPCARVSGETLGGISIVCQSDDAATPSSTPTSSAATPSFPTGAYTCTDDVSSYGPKDQLLVGGKGTLMVSQSGDDVTVALVDNVGFPTGTLQFAATTDATASAVGDDQTLSAGCLLTNAAPQSTINLTSAAMTVTGGTLFLTFAGEFDATCEGLSSGGSLACTKQ